MARFCGIASRRESSTSWCAPYVNILDSFAKNRNIDHLFRARTDFGYLPDVCRWTYTMKHVLLFHPSGLRVFCFSYSFWFLFSDQITLRVWRTNGRASRTSQSDNINLQSSRATSPKEHLRFLTWWFACHIVSLATPKTALMQGDAQDHSPCFVRSIFLD